MLGTQTVARVLNGLGAEAEVGVATRAEAGEEAGAAAHGSAKERKREREGTEAGAQRSENGSVKERMVWNNCIEFIVFKFRTIES